MHVSKLRFESVVRRSRGAKRSFAPLRSQAELGSESIGVPAKTSPAHAARPEAPTQMLLPRPFRWLLLGGAAFAVTSAVYSVPQPAQPKVDYRTPARMVGIATCDACHRGATPRYREQGRTDFCRLDESSIWDAEDLHKRASDALDESKNRLAASMAKILGGKLTQKVECLVCHAVDRAPLIPLKEKTLGNFYTRDGVSCESCHGFADVWNDPHYRPEFQGEKLVVPWRSLTPAKKEDA